MDERRAGRRGGWVRRVLVLTVLIGVGAVGGYFWVGTWYVSVAKLYIHQMTLGPLLPSAAGDADSRNGSYMAFQMETIESDRVRNKAMDSQGWRGAGQRAIHYGSELFSEHLKLSENRATGNIFVSFTDPDPALARVAVQEIIAAYFDVYDNFDSSFWLKRSQLLDERQRELTEKIQKLEGDFSETTIGIKGEAATQPSAELVNARSELKDVKSVIEHERSETPDPVVHRSVEVASELLTRPLREPQVQGAKIGAGAGFLVGLGVMAVAGARRRRTVEMG